MTPLGAHQVVFVCPRCGLKGNPPQCEHFQQPWSPERIAEVHRQLSPSPDLGGLILRLIHELEYLADGKSETGMYAYVDDNGACYDAGGAVKKAIREALAVLQGIKAEE